jgi:hypothetical protein
MFLFLLRLIIDNGTGEDSGAVCMCDGYKGGRGVGGYEGILR